MYSREHNIGVATAYCGEGDQSAGFLSLYDRPPALSRLFAWPGVPMSPGGAVVALLAFLFSDALEEIQVLHVDPPLSQFYDPLVLESLESKGYGHPSGSYDGSQLLVGVVVGYD